MKILSLVCICLLSLNGFAAEKTKPRDPASRKKTVKSITCSNAGGDGGYSITIYSGKDQRATVLENNIAGAFVAANLNCEFLPQTTGPVGNDMIQTFMKCTGKGIAGEHKDKDFRVVLSRGGFAGITEADMNVDGVEILNDVICK